MSVSIGKGRNLREKGCAGKNGQQGTKKGPSFHRSKTKWVINRNETKTLILQVSELMTRPQGMLPGRFPVRRQVVIFLYPSFFVVVSGLIKQCSRTSRKCPELQGLTYPASGISKRLEYNSMPPCRFPAFCKNGSDSPSIRANLTVALKKCS